MTTRVSVRTSRPASVRFHTGGTLSYRGRDERHRNCGLTQLSSAQYLSLHHRVRGRVVFVEFLRGSSLVAGTKAIVTKH